jgi:hypothetical protein
MDLDHTLTCSLSLSCVLPSVRSGGPNVKCQAISLFFLWRWLQRLYLAGITDSCHSSLLGDNLCYPGASYIVPRKYSAPACVRNWCFSTTYMTEKGGLRENCMTYTSWENVWTAFSFEMGLIDCSEASFTYYKSTLRNIPETKTYLHGLNRSAFARWVT